VKTGPSAEVVPFPPVGAQSCCAPTTKGNWSLWLPVVAAFLLLLIAWGVMFAVARLAKVESVPLATGRATP